MKRILVLVIGVLCFPAAGAERFEVVSDVPGVFAVTVLEAEATTYSLVLTTADGSSSATRTAAARNGEAHLIFRNMPTGGEAFRVAVRRFEGGVWELVYAPRPTLRTFDALGQYPADYLAALNEAATAAGYNGAQKAAIRSLIEDAMVRLVTAQRASEVAAEELAVTRRKRLLGVE